MRAKSRLGAGARRSRGRGRQASVHMLEQRLLEQQGLAPRLEAAGPGSAIIGLSTCAQQQNHFNWCHCLSKQRVRVPNLTAALRNWLCQWDSSSQRCNINVTDKEQIVNWVERRGMCLNRQIVNISSSMLPDTCWFMYLASALGCTRLWISGREETGLNGSCNEYRNWCLQGAAGQLSQLSRGCPPACQFVLQCHSNR